MTLIPHTQINSCLQQPLGTRDEPECYSTSYNSDTSILEPTMKICLYTNGQCSNVHDFQSSIPICIANCNNAISSVVFIFANHLCGLILPSSVSSNHRIMSFVGLIFSDRMSSRNSATHCSPLHTAEFEFLDDIGTILGRVRNRGSPWIGQDAGLASVLHKHPTSFQHSGSAHRGPP